MNQSFHPTKRPAESLEAWLQLLDANGHHALAWLTHDVFRMGLQRGQFRLSIPARDALNLAQGVPRLIAILAGGGTFLLPGFLLARWSVGQSPMAVLMAWATPMAAVFGFQRLRRAASTRWPWIGVGTAIAAVLLAGSPWGIPQLPGILGIGLAWGLGWPGLMDWLCHTAAAQTLKRRADHFNRAIALGKIRIERRRLG